MSISAHAGLSCSFASDRTADLVLLGEVIDPRDPLASNASIAARLAACSETFDAFERDSARIGGRWAALVRISGQTRVYPDAGATKSVFYCAAPGGGVFLASQPGLLVGARVTEHLAQLDRDMMAHAHGDAWPLGSTPYRGVRQLRPNHYLDVATGREVRFWPAGDLPETELGEVADLALTILGGVVASAAHRGRTTLPLTGGYDSRSIFAAAFKAGVLGQIDFARVSGHHLPFYDAHIPKRIAAQFGVKLSILASHSSSPDSTALLKSNISNMMWDPADYMLPFFGKMGADILLLGQLSEIARCPYSRQETSPRAITPEVAARYSGFGGNPVVIAEFEEWCEQLPRLGNLSALDLLYWENRCGTWASLLATALDTYSTILYPFNSRELLVAMLGLKEEFRLPPHRIHREICGRGSKRLLEHEFNGSPIDRAIQRAPWRAQQLLASIRRFAHRFE